MAQAQIDSLPHDSSEVANTFKCEHCDKVYQRSNSLKRHVNTRHEPELLYKLKIENETLNMQIFMLWEQIEFYKKHITNQENTIVSDNATRSGDINNNDNYNQGIFE